MIAGPAAQRGYRPVVMAICFRPGPVRAVFVPGLGMGGRLGPNGRELPARGHGRFIFPKV